MSKSKIEWCTHTENPFAGCKHGCSYCYARRYAHRLSGNSKTMQNALFSIGLDPFTPACCPELFERLDAKLTSAIKPRHVFLGSMGDIGGEWDYVLVRSSRDGSSYYVALDENKDEPLIMYHDEVVRWTSRIISKFGGIHHFILLTKNPFYIQRYKWWQSNVSIGVSASCMDDAYERLLGLGDVSVQNKWISVEPLMDKDFDPSVLSTCKGLGWVVVGGMSRMTNGSQIFSRDSIVRSAKRIVEWCKRNGVPCFVKDNMQSLDREYNWPVQIVERG